LPLALFCFCVAEHALVCVITRKTGGANTTLSYDEFADTLLELEERFGTVSSESRTIAGQLRHEGHVYRDESVRVFVDVPDTEENRQFFIAFKETLKQRFQPSC
jgi:hypothetical protein